MSNQKYFQTLFSVTEDEVDSKKNFVTLYD